MDLGRWTRLIDLRKEYEQGWNERLIRDICDEQTVKAILNLNWHAPRGEDNLYWCGNTRPIFLLSNCYLLNCCNNDVDNGIWKIHWSSKIHEQLKIFAWRVLANVLPTRELLNRRLDLQDTFMFGVWESNRNLFSFF